MHLERLRPSAVESCAAQGQAGAYEHQDEGMVLSLAVRISPSLDLVFAKDIHRSHSITAWQVPSCRSSLVC